MTRYIDADALIEQMQAEAEHMDSKIARMMLYGCIHEVEYAPTADVVEVVRCKDCKWFNDFGCAIRIVDDSDKPKDNDFCSFGERKETEDE